MPERRPKVFISSTIYDFRDLRSALRYWFEELDYEVLLSDHSDFPVQVDLNSYENCLKSIDDCDYFILLVGSRVGGWYDAKKRISITQAEYRRAYEQLKRGRIKLISFVRQELWDVREDRAALQKVLESDMLKEAELEPADIAKIVNHSSKFARDPEFTFQFMREIARTEEMKLAIAGGGPFPVGNWIRQFTSFRDIVEALKVELGISTNLRREILLANLRTEIESNLNVLLDQAGAGGESGLRPQYEWASYASDALTGGVNASSTIEGHHARFLGIFVLKSGATGKLLNTRALDEAITSGEMLEFDASTNTFVVGEMQQALMDLRRNIERLRQNEAVLDVAARIKLAERLRQLTDDQTITVTNLELVPVLAIHDSQVNVVTLSRAIHRASTSDLSLLQKLSLYGDSPIEEENELMQTERPTSEQLKQWLAQED